MAEKLRAPITARLVAEQRKTFSHKLVFDGLRNALQRAGIVIENAESAEDGPGSELALRVVPRSASAFSARLEVGVELRPYGEEVKGWNVKIVLRGLRKQLLEHGLKIRKAEAAEDGRGSEYAIRARV